MALTVTNRRNNVVGNMRQITATLVSTTGTDSWVTGLRLIRGISLDTVSGASAACGASAIVGGTVTLSVSAAQSVNAIVTGF